MGTFNDLQACSTVAVVRSLINICSFLTFKWLCRHLIVPTASSASWGHFGQKLTYRIAWSLWASLISGLWFLLAIMSFKDAPTMALWNFWVFLVRFLAVSSSWPFLCLRLYRTVHVTFRGFLLIKWARSHFELRKVKFWNEVRYCYDAEPIWDGPALKAGMFWANWGALVLILRADLPFHQLWPGSFHGLGTSCTRCTRKARS